MSTAQVLRKSPMRAMAVRGQVMSLKPLPLRTTMRMIFMKWLGGKVDTMACAQPGMLSMAVNTPLIMLKILMKKKARDIDCCCVAE